MANEIVLLTGATGMIGFKTLALLLEAGHHVRAAVRNQEGFDRISSLKAVAPYKSQLESVIVPDITVPGAYDNAVKGVTYIVHVASPLPGNTKGTDADDYEASIIRPAIQGTVGILESAVEEPGIKRVVITASVVSLVTPGKYDNSQIITEQTKDAHTEGPWSSQMEAYPASKALAYQATKKFVADNNTSFDLINIMPVYVIGRDETVSDASSIAKGTNGLVMGPLLGYPLPGTPNGLTVHVDDVAKMHVLSLDPKVEGNQDYLAAGPNFGSIAWADSFAVVKKRYPKEYADGVFKFESVPEPATDAGRVDNSKAVKAFGIQFKSFEEQVVSVVDHFLELTGRR